MKRYFGYARVSTKRQGDGVSIPEQRDAIRLYAAKNNLTLLDWFEEHETAAKRGRPVFGRMMKLLRQGKADGVIIHKIDRSARNLKDWSDLGELIDQGIEVHFANESLDLHSRGGRLSADIQAVIAADFIRNLKQEVRKGMFGRLKQGLYPLPAPVGYLNAGKGKPKPIDPIIGPLIRRAFELYASGRFNQHTLADELYRLGLRNTSGKKINDKRLSTILNNPFYMGVIRLRSGETFEGIHEPLISKAIYDRVQKILKGRLNTRIQKHGFTYRRLLKCRHCGWSLIGERQKGRVYYRCHSRGCPTKGLREDTVEAAFASVLAPLQFSEAEKGYLKKKTMAMRGESVNRRDEEFSALKLRLGQLKDRLGRLTDAFLDQSIDKETFNERKEAFVFERKDIEGRVAELERDGGQTVQRVTEFVELAGSLWLSHQMAIGDEKREMVEIAMSNIWVDGKNLVVELRKPFAVIANRAKHDDGAARRGMPRTLDALLDALIKILSKSTITSTHMYILCQLTSIHSLLTCLSFVSLSP